MRNPTKDEIRLLERLISKASKIIPDNWSNKLKVSKMNDGDMGSLLLFPNEKIKKDRIFGDRISEIQFIDSDGVEVLASLNIDRDGDLFEPDIWKIDFSKLVNFPLF
jgi:hypothetical protein